MFLIFSNIALANELLVQINEVHESQIQKSEAFQSYLVEKGVSSSELGLIGNELVSSVNGSRAGETVYNVAYMYLGANEQPFVILFSLRIEWESGEGSERFYVEKLIEADGSKIPELRANGAQDEKDIYTSESLESAISEVEGNIDISLQMIATSQRLAGMYAVVFEQNAKDLSQKEKEAVVKVISVLSSRNHNEKIDSITEFQVFLASTNNVSQNEKDTIKNFQSRVNEDLFLEIINFGASISRLSRTIDVEIKMITNSVETLQKYKEFFEKRTAVAQYADSLKTLNRLLGSLDEYINKLFALSSKINDYRDSFLLQVTQGKVNSLAALGENQELPFQFVEEALKDVKLLFSRVSGSSVQCKSLLN